MGRRYGSCLEAEHRAERSGLRSDDSPREREDTLIIDCHVHLNRYDETQPERLEDRYALLKEEMEKNGISYGLVLTSYMVNDHRPGVAEMIAVMGDDPQIGIVAGISYQNYRAADLAQYRELLLDGKIKGFKLYPGYEPFFVHDPRLRVVYELAGEFGIPVMIHTGDTYNPRGRLKYSHPLQVDEVAVDHRDVTFVICHLGNPWFVDAMEVIYKNQNVVGDISGLTLGHFEERFERFMLQRLREVVTFAGDPSSLLFGTDWPICDVGSYIRLVHNLGFEKEESEQIFYKNTARVFHLDIGESVAPVAGA
jgi:uncharacterized protein